MDPDFHRGDGVGPPPPVIPAKAGIHVPPNPHSAPKSTLRHPRHSGESGIHASTPAQPSGIHDAPKARKGRGLPIFIGERLRPPNSPPRPLRETPTPQTAPFACSNVLDKQNAAMLQMTASTTESQQRGPGGDLDMPVLIGVSLPMSRLMDPSIVPRSPPRGSGM